MTPLIQSTILQKDIQDQLTVTEGIFSFLFKLIDYLIEIE